MTWRIEQIVTLVGCRTPDLETWIAEQWIRPIRDDDGWVFAEADLARAQLIRDLTGELAIDTETVPVVLSLIDQNHALRRQLHDILAAIGNLPPDTRDEIMRQLGLGEIS
jgi:chaperone modulatory protein CbpM